jgi:peptidoglycan/LPS O-acetylase OafA/YrhL
MHTALRSPLRWLAAALLLVVAAVHIPMVPEHLHEAPYIGVLFIALAVIGVALAALLVRWDTPAVWVVSGTVALLAVFAFLFSRTIGLPELGDDIGNWSEPLGFPALAAELLATAVAATVLRHLPSQHTRKGTP